MTSGREAAAKTPTHPSSTVNPGKQKSVDGVPVSLQINASDVRGRALAYAATGLPAGLAINASSGVISGIPSGHGRSETTVVVADSSASTTVAFVWMIKR